MSCKTRTLIRSDLHPNLLCNKPPSHARNRPITPFLLIAHKVQIVRTTLNLNLSGYSRQSISNRTHFELGSLTQNRGTHHAPCSLPKSGRLANSRGLRNWQRLFVFLSSAAVCGPGDRRLFNFAGFEFTYFNV